jgi:hypothetical protein
VDNQKELSPLAKADIELGKPLAFPIYDQQGKLLLAAGKAITTQRQLDELSVKGLYRNPRWSHVAATVATRGSVKPEAEIRSNAPKAVQAEEAFETGSVLRMSVPGQPDVFNVRLVGTLGKEAFVVAHPMRDSACIFVKEGQVWEFKAFYGLSIFRFTAMAEKVLLSPYPMVVFSWPQDGHSETRNVRSARRIACEIPAAVRLGEPGSLTVTAVVTNLSTGGAEARLSSFQTVKTGTTVFVAFQLSIAGRKYLFELNAKVASQDLAGDTNVLGLAFGEMDNAQFFAIHAFVCDRLITKLGSPLYGAG